MIASAIGLRISRFVAIFVGLRLVEAATAIVALLAISAIRPGIDDGVQHLWLVSTELGSALRILRIYYFGFHYLLFSFIAFAVVGALFGLNRLSVVVPTNLGAFVLHSVAFVALVFGRDFGVFWIVWVAVVTANVLGPLLLDKLHLY